MAIFNKAKANRIKMQVKNPDNTFSENIPITDSSSVVVDNDNEIFLDETLNDINVNITNVNEYIDSVLEGPSNTYIHPYTGYKIYDIAAGDGYSYMAIGNTFQSFTHTGSTQEITQNNSPTSAITYRYSERTITTEPLATMSAGYGVAKHIGYNTVVYAEGPVITCVNYANKGIKSKNMFSIVSGREGVISDLDVIIPSNYTGSTNDTIYAVCVGKPGSGDDYATLGIIKFTPFNTNTQHTTVTSRLQTTTTAMPASVKVTQNKIFVAYSFYIDVFNFNTSNMSLTSDTKFAFDTKNVEIINIELINNDNSILVAYNDGTTPKIIRLEYNATSKQITKNSSFNYTAYSGGTIRGMVKDKNENIYVVYSDGKLIRYDLSLNNLWEYDWGINSVPSSLAIDDEMNYIVIGAENGQFETVKVNLIESAVMSLNLLDSRTMSIRSELLSVEEGSLIEKIEVCQLNGEIELTGDIVGNTTLVADNTCLTDPDSSSHGESHKIVLEASLSSDATIDKDITAEDEDYQVVNKKYVDNAITEAPEDMVVSETVPTNLAVGGIWIKPM